MATLATLEKVRNDDGDFVGCLYDTIMYERAVYRLKHQHKYDFPVRYQTLAHDFAEAYRFCLQPTFAQNPETAHYADCIRVSRVATVSGMKLYVEENLGYYDIFPAEDVLDPGFYDNDLDELNEDDFSDFDSVVQQMGTIKKNVGFQGCTLTKKHEVEMAKAFAGIPNDSRDMIAAIIHYLRTNVWKHRGSGGDSVFLMDGVTMGVQKYSRPIDGYESKGEDYPPVSGSSREDTASPLRPVNMLPPLFGYNWKGPTYRLACVDLPARGSDYGFYASLTRVLMEKYQSLLPPLELMDRFQRLKASIEDFLVKSFPGEKLRVEAFGSFVTGMLSPDSDADFCIMGPDIHKHALLNDMPYLAAELKRYGFTSIRAISGATVPIVKFHDPNTNLDCDLNTGNYLGIINSNLIRTYISLDPRVKPFLYLVKNISHAQGINSFRDGTLSSYAVIMMGIVYLQTLPGDLGRRQKPILPRLQVQPAARMSEEDVRLNHGGSTNSVVGNERRHEIIQTRYDKNLDELHTGAGRDNTMLLSELLIGFFEFYSRQFAYTEKAIHVAQGDYLNKTHNEKFKERGVPSLRIIDPFLHHRNIAGKCRGDNLKKMWEAFNHVYLALSGGDLDKAMKRYDQREVDLYNVLN
ncbi:hypothetical protein BG005_007925 [Podila minutissima]|nr:hypothetical protein BG005_007925 [Podila minutissima]